jgi:hypothetical protein
MIANTLAASGGIFAAWQISVFEAAPGRHLTEAKTPENTAGHGPPVRP